MSLLRENSVTAVADVRSQPFSKSNPEFTSAPLRETLRQFGISYVFLGEELGARSTDKRCYVAGKVQYDLIASSPSFQAGLDRVEKGRTNHSIALMCAEKEPLNCHRCILVGRHLRARGVPIRHILDDGVVEDHDSSILRLMQLLRISDAWRPEMSKDKLTMAYEVQGERIAFRKDAVEVVQYGLWG